MLAPGLFKGVRLELMADAGMTTFSSDSEVDALVISEKTVGSSKSERRGRRRG